jgi:hypothetical protein
MESVPPAGFRCRPFGQGVLTVFIACSVDTATIASTAIGSCSTVSDACNCAGRVLGIRWMVTMPVKPVAVIALLIYHLALTRFTNAMLRVCDRSLARSRLHA